MIKTLSGANSFLITHSLNEVVEDFVKKYGDLAIERIDGQEAPLEQIRNSLQVLPFLVEKKLVVLRSPGQNAQFQAEAETLLDQLPDSTDLIIVEPKLDKRAAYYKLLRKRTDFLEFNEPDATSLSQWLVQNAKTQGGNLSVGDARYLIDRIGTNQQLLAHELTKLIIYDTQVSRHSIDLLTELTPQSSIFQLLDAAFSGNRAALLKLYAEQRALKVEPAQIIAMLVWQLHVVAIVKAAGTRAPADIAREAKLNPFVVQKSAQIARRLTLSALKTYLSELENMDFRLKRNNLDADESLQYFLLRLSEPISLSHAV